MGTELKIDIGTIYAFLLVLARISGVFIYVPLPGMRSGSEMARAVMSVSMTLVLFSSWPQVRATDVSLGVFLGWMLAEAGLGLAVGLVVASLTEAFQMGAQIISLQAGYSYATTVDPTSGADSSVLLTIAQTSAGLLFFATGLDRQVLMAFGRSLTTYPPGHFEISQTLANLVIQTGSTIFSTGLRLVLPLLGLLLMVEISLALLARLNSQLQLMQLAFPIKMLLALSLMGWLVLIFPKAFAQSSVHVLHLVRTLLAV
jgi:flagellar biosynthetic protein FliR